MSQRPEVHPLRRWIFDLVNDRAPTRTGRAFNIAMMILIALNVVLIVLESFQSLRTVGSPLFRWLELFSVAIFSLEYLLRLVTADMKYPEKTPLAAVFSYLASPLALIDLLAILPFYLPLLISMDWRFIRIIRILRLVRLLKLNRYSRALKLIGDVLIEKRADLGVTIFIASTIMYSIEGEVQPQAFPNIISTFWWAVATLTTVGYGDVYPITPWGKLLSGLMAIIGIGIVALPTGIISATFVGKLTKPTGLPRPTENVCPHCGGNLSDRTRVPETPGRDREG
jgi:voltage-gated potassium channel